MYQVLLKSEGVRPFFCDQLAWNYPIVFVDISGVLVYIIFTHLFFLYILYTVSLCQGNYNL